MAGFCVGGFELSGLVTYLSCRITLRINVCFIGVYFMWAYCTNLLYDGPFLQLSFYLRLMLRLYWTSATKNINSTNKCVSTSIVKFYRIPLSSFKDETFVLMGRPYYVFIWCTLCRRRTETGYYFPLLCKYSYSKFKKCYEFHESSRFF
jgi:hypothetical protein